MDSVISDLLQINKAFKLKKINKRKRKPLHEGSTDQKSHDHNSEEEPKSPPEPSTDSRKGFKVYDPSSDPLRAVSEQT